MAVQNRAALLAQITALLADNVTNDISELDMRTVTGDAVDSCFNLLTDLVTTALITNNAVTHAKYQDIGTSTMLGRISAGSGDPQELTTAQIRSLLNVANGATIDQNLFLNFATPAQPTIIAGTTTDTINIVPGTGIGIVNVAGTNTMTISSPAQNLFATIASTAQPSIIVTGATDTLTIEGGTGVSITTVAATKTMTINAAPTTMSSEIFADGVGYVAGVSNSLTLAAAPSGINKLFVNFSGDMQFTDQILSLVGNTLTFTSVIPIGTNRIEVRSLS